MHPHPPPSAPPPLVPCSFGITLMMFTAYGTMSVMITPDKSLAGLFMAFFFAFFNLFCGFLIPAASIPG